MTVVRPTEVRFGGVGWGGGYAEKSAANSGKWWKAEDAVQKGPRFSNLPPAAVVPAAGRCGILHVLALGDGQVIEHLARERGRGGDWGAAVGGSTGGGERVHGER